MKPRTPNGWKIVFSMKVLEKQDKNKNNKTTPISQQEGRNY